MDMDKSLIRLVEPETAFAGRESLIAYLEYALEEVSACD